MTLHFGGVAGHKFDNQGELTVIYCGGCHFRHLYPIPQTDIYTDGTYHRDIKSDMKRDEDEDALWHDMWDDDIISLIKPLAPNSSLLDVGCGTGRFLDSAKRNSFLSYGVEPDQFMASLREDVMWAEYKDVASKNWGIITAHFVIEHLPDPIHFLEWSHRALADNGVLCVTIPNDFSSVQEMAAHHLKRPYFWLHRTHVNYWSALDFPVFLKQHSFTPIHAYGSWEPERYLLEDKVYLDDHILGRQLHHERTQHDLECTREYRLSKYLLLGAEGRGRDVTFVAVKK